MHSSVVDPPHRVQTSQSDVPMPVARNPRYLTLDLWRGLACLMIVVLHATHNATEARATADVAGKLIMRDRRLLTVDVPSTLTELTPRLAELTDISHGRSIQDYGF